MVDKWCVFAQEPSGVRHLESFVKRLDRPLMLTLLHTTSQWVGSEGFIYWLVVFKICEYLS